MTERSERKRGVPAPGTPETDETPLVIIGQGDYARTLAPRDLGVHDPRPDQQGAGDTPCTEVPPLSSVELPMLTGLADALDEVCAALAVVVFELRNLAQLGATWRNLGQHAVPGGGYVRERVGVAEVAPASVVGPPHVIVGGLGAAGGCGSAVADDVTAHAGDLGDLA